MRPLVLCFPLVTLLTFTGFLSVLIHYRFLQLQLSYMLINYLPVLYFLIAVSLFFVSRHCVCFLYQMRCSFFTVICSLYLLQLSSFKDNFTLFQNMLLCQVFRSSVLLFVHDTVFPRVFYSF